MKKIRLSSLLLAMGVASMAFAQDLEDNFTVSYTAQASCQLTLEQEASRVDLILGVQVSETNPIRQPFQL